MGSYYDFYAFQQGFHQVPHFGWPLDDQFNFFWPDIAFLRSEIFYISKIIRIETQIETSKNSFFHVWAHCGLLWSLNTLISCSFGPSLLPNDPIGLKYSQWIAARYSLYFWPEIMSFSKNCITYLVKNNKNQGKITYFLEKMHLYGNLRHSMAPHY